ncbi:MAG: ATP-dependent Clp protease ATP-binding subunit [Acidobacteriota bacterium]|nr:ATP-dependent Clp protease ATP-binding subunit [Acidobacteriota bacterium]
MDEPVKGWLTLATVGLIMVVLGFAIQGMPAGFLAAGVGIAWTKWHRPLPLKSFFWGRPAVLTGLFFVAGESAALALQNLYFLTHGVAAERVALALVGAVASIAAATFLHRIFKGELMPSIFDFVNDPQALQAFVNGESEQQHQTAYAVESLHPFDVDGASQEVAEVVIGQDGIVRDVVALISRRIEMQRKHKPLGVVLFVGATGAGKTELAKALSDLIFGGDKLLRFDCNEMVESSSAQRLIGAPPGYLGSEQGGQLTRGIQRNRTGVILFDEIEKAHPDVYKVLMGLFDEGRITEQSTGQTMDASGHLIVLTSNAEHQKIADLVKNEQDPAVRRIGVKDALAGVFRPEQLARIDEIYAFPPLDRLAMVSIVAKSLQHLAKEAGIELVKVDAAVLIDAVTMHERMQQYGIRELLRVVEKRVVDRLFDARRAGHSQVRIAVQGDAVQVLPAETSTVTGGNHAASA